MKTIGFLVVVVVALLVFIVQQSNTPDDRPLSVRATEECQRQFPNDARGVERCLAGFIVRMHQEKLESDRAKMDDAYRRTR